MIDGKINYKNGFKLSFLDVIFKRRIKMFISRTVI